MPAISNAGIVYDIIGEFTKAQKYFNQGLLRDPSNTSLLYNLANCLFNSKDYKRAIGVCQKIIKLDASFYYAYNRWGLCCIQLELEGKAKECFEKSIKIKPDYAEGLTNYGFILQKLRKYSLASLQFEKVLKIQPNSDEALVNLSKCYSDEGRLSSKYPFLSLSVSRGILTEAPRFATP